MKPKTKKAERYHNMKVTQDQVRDQMYEMLQKFEPDELMDLLYEACNTKEEKVFNQAIEDHIQSHTSYILIKIKTLKEQHMLEVHLKKIFTNFNDMNTNVIFNL